MKCVLCGNETDGSIGAAGIHWKHICQPCKDSEDQALKLRVLRNKNMIDTVFGMLITPRHFKVLKSESSDLQGIEQNPEYERRALARIEPNTFVGREGKPDGNEND